MSNAALRVPVSVVSPFGVSVMLVGGPWLAKLARLSQALGRAKAVPLAA